MRKLISGVIIGVLGFYAYGKYHDARAEALAEARQASEAPIAVEYSEPAITTTPITTATSTYRCDGRVYCSQMTSCEEATWFLQNCPGTKMDGEGDGVPCEKQWCGLH